MAPDELENPAVNLPPQENPAVNPPPAENPAVNPPPLENPAVNPLPILAELQRIILQLNSMYLVTVHV